MPARKSIIYITDGDYLEARKKIVGTRKVFYSVSGCYSGRLLTNRSVNFVFFADFRIAVQVRLKTKLSLLIRFFYKLRSEYVASRRTSSRRQLPASTKSSC